MTFSKRAVDFLKKSERVMLPLSEAEIRAIFDYNHAPIFEPLIEFQMRFGGFIFYAELVPIQFSLIKGLGGYPHSSPTAIIEFEVSEFTSPKYFFDCATTDYQMNFFLDENGVYYEDYEAKASSFAKMVEHLALWDELSKLKDFEVIFHDRILKTNQIDKELNLDLITEASDQYTLWFRNENMYMQQWRGQTTLIVSKNYQDKSKLLALS